MSIGASGPGSSLVIVVPPASKVPGGGMAAEEAAVVGDGGDAALASSVGSLAINFLPGHPLSSSDMSPEWKKGHLLAKHLGRSSGSSDLLHMIYLMDIVSFVSAIRRSISLAQSFPSPASCKLASIFWRKVNMFPICLSYDPRIFSLLKSSCA